MGDSELLIDYKVGLAYCRPYYSEHEVTRQVLSYLSDKEFLIDIRLDCWNRLNSAIKAELKLLDYLLDEATRLLTDNAPDEALAAYQSNVLTESNLFDGGPPGVSFEEDLAPEVEDLRAAIEDMGLDDFRVYAHDLLDLCPKAQSKLDLMIRERYEASAQDPWVFSANAGRIVENQRQVDALCDAYVWSNEAGKYFIVSEETAMYSRKSEILDGCSDDRLKIICPRDIQTEIT